MPLETRNMLLSPKTPVAPHLNSNVLTCSCSSGMPFNDPDCSLCFASSCGLRTPGKPHGTTSIKVTNTPDSALSDALVKRNSKQKKADNDRSNGQSGVYCSFCWYLDPNLIIDVAKPSKKRSRLAAKNKNVLQVTQIHTYTRIRHSRIHTYTHTHIHTYTHTHTHIHPCTHTHIHTFTHTHIHTYTHTHIHTYTHTHTYTHIHTHTQTGGKVCDEDPGRICRPQG
jgi:hypothetical protein